MTDAGLNALRERLRSRVRETLRNLPCFQRPHHYLDDCPNCGAQYAVPLAAEFTSLHERCYRCDELVVCNLGAVLRPVAALRRRRAG